MFFPMFIIQGEIVLKKAKIAVLVLTPEAKKIAVNLKKKQPNLDLFLSQRLAMSKTKNDFKTFSSLKKTVSKIFKDYDALVFIMSLGIVVRIIANLLESKKTDPAIITIDDQGQNVISTLSGHLGGANKLTLEIAEILKAKPVITTATDCNNKLAVDLLAQRLNCEIKPFKRLKKANSALLFKQELHIFSDYKFELKEDNNLKKYPLAEFDSSAQANVFKVIVDNHNFKLGKNQIQLFPKNLIIGLGCRKNTPFWKLEQALNQFLAQNNLAQASIKSLATIDLKKDETGILKLAAKYNWPLEIIERSEIKKVEADLEIAKSDFVKKTIGVSAAAAPAAILASKSGQLIIDKTKYSGITLAVVEEEIKSE
jgi:cobalt-precorrin 5A hydrolase